MVFFFGTILRFTFDIHLSEDSDPSGDELLPSLSVLKLFTVLGASYRKIVVHIVSKKRKIVMQNGTTLNLPKGPISW